MRCAEKVAAAYRLGQRDALADAVQRIEALPWTSETWTAHAERAAIIAAIKKGEQ
jgi:cytidine deaminase